MHRLSRKEDMANIVQAALTAMRKTYPEITTFEFYDQLVNATAWFGAGIAEAEPNPMETAEQIGAVFAANIKRFIATKNPS